MTISKFSKLIIVSALLAVPTQVGAQDGPNAIEIRATSALGAWQKDTSAALDKALARAPSLRGSNANEAVVQVAFDIGLDGRATHVRVLPGDGNFAAQRAAVFAVKSLDTLDDIPVMSAGRPVLANVILYKNQASLAKMRGELAHRERARLASIGAVTDYVVIGAVPSISVG